MENLVIVESPAKAKTFQKYLGKDFTVKASFGHIRDLQDKKLSINVDKGFEPEYVIPADKRRVVNELRKAAAESSIVWLASDEDREGEAISWHLCETLGLDPSKTRRIVFHEITKDAIQNAVRNPRTIDMNLVNAQQARRVLAAWSVSSSLPYCGGKSSRSFPQAAYSPSHSAWSLTERRRSWISKVSLSTASKQCSTRRARLLPSR